MINNQVQGRYNEQARTLLITCPFCKHTSHIVFKEDGVMKPKDYLGHFICYGGYNSVTKQNEDCGKELFITEIK